MSAEAHTYKIELAGAILISLAALFTAWCGFQSSRWNGLQNHELAEENRKNSAATEKTLNFNQYRLFDGILALTMMNATAEGKQSLIDFYLARLRPDLSKVMKQWIDSKPLENPAAYPNPLAQPGYAAMVEAELGKAEAWRKEAEAHRNTALHADKTSDNYLLLTIIFSAVMFLSGIESKFHIVKVRMALVFLSAALFVFAIIRLVELPLM